MSSKISSGGWDAVQLALGTAGLVPGFGEVFDLADAGISYLRGDYLGASLSMAAMIPGIGNVAGAGKLARTASMATSRAARREAMRRTNTPTSRSFMEQSGKEGRRQYTVEGADGKPRIITQHPADKDHPKPHWHSSTPKVDRQGKIKLNTYGQAKYESGGSSVPYGD
jgi:hypothetical protein